MVEPCNTNIQRGNGAIIPILISPIILSDFRSSLFSVWYYSILFLKVIAVPTDTIYGIAGLAQNSEAVNRIYQIKGKVKII